MFGDKMNVYIASSLDNSASVAKAAEFFESHGYQITYKWHEHGRIEDESKLAEIGKLEYQGVVDADFLVLLMPARYGSHVEFGIALALNKPIYIITGGHEFEEKSFYHLPLVSRYEDLQQLIGGVDNGRKYTQEA